MRREHSQRVSASMLYEYGASVGQSIDGRKQSTMEEAQQGDGRRVARYRREWAGDKGR